VRVAVVGAGVSGLVCAHRLKDLHDVTVFEADTRPGGHSRTVHVQLGPDEAHDVDVGFIVFNETYYPRFTELLAELGVATQPSTMSFSVSDPRIGLEYCPTNLDHVFAQRSNATRPWFLRMLLDIVRFNRRARRLVAEADAAVGRDGRRRGARTLDELTLQDFVEEGNHSSAFVDDFLVPLGASIWSADPEAFTRFPAVTYARFMQNHGLLTLRRGPQWRTITGGSQRYVDALVAGLGSRLRLGQAVHKIRRGADDEGAIEVVTEGGAPEMFDRIVLAGHSDQMLGLLSDPTGAERAILGGVRYQPNVATLHTDERFLPRCRRARASWNYHVGAAATSPTGSPAAALTYWMNELQSIRSSRPLLVTLNRHDEIDPEAVLGRFDFDHPVFDLGALRSQRRLAEIQGVDGTYYAGAYWGYGFHEDGVRSALDVCRHLGVTG